ncbi:hypothetical protein ASF49_09915 [Methylobacterium sp. Leaf104]|uniref:hypothetical protein n=1 Tax=Methylobacterium TaxID=407 RepID=UPI0007018CCF|nr:MULTISPECIES: hypothetical protein [Methylobacterium]KQP31742.1 hypothetical protein ASF49_09915 [Methylobacterium sp. Leaf104]MCI9880659.1 hypothetical protein [Methylobacterium goesingense]
MRIQPTHAVAPYLLLAELGAALFGGAAASAEERITLEVIGAVRMAGPDTSRRSAASSQRSEARPMRETIAERTDAPVWSVRH